jgi:hypothetical protein
LGEQTARGVYKLSSSSSVFIQNEPWFNEKYNPELLDALEKERREHVKRLSEEFMARLDAGFYDKIDLRVNDVVPS